MAATVKHKSTGAGPLWYRVGHVNTSNNTIQWGNSFWYDNGMNPSIAIFESTIAEVHNGTAGLGPLWYHVGQVNTSSDTIQWGNSVWYDNGLKPTVAIIFEPFKAVEVHNGGYGMGWHGTGLLDNVGYFTGASTIHWYGSAQYDNGMNPCVAAGFRGTVVEVHDGVGGVGPLWYRVAHLPITQ